ICCAATGTLICTNTTSDPNNCGGCNIWCPPDSKCQGGNCVPATTTCNGGPPCTGVDTCCGAGCTDTQTDPNNCSGCGFLCPTGDTCVGGNCTPPASCDGGPVCTGVKQCCASGCSNVNTDPANCGSCGNACAPGDTCQGG